MTLDGRIENAAKVLYEQIGEHCVGYGSDPWERLLVDPEKRIFIDAARACIAAFQKDTRRLRLPDNECNADCPLWGNCDEDVETCPGPGIYALDPVVEAKK